MESLNKKDELWNELIIEELETREEFAISCFKLCFSCFCFKCFGF